jgi:hypothetical protein
MPPATASARADHPAARRRPKSDGEKLLSSYLTALDARGAGNRSFTGAARAFLTRWPDPQWWANSALRPLLNYLMLAGHLRPGYDYLLERKLSAVLREAAASPLADDMDRFLSAATELGYTRRVAAGLASQIVVRILIQTGRTLREVTDGDLDEFAAAITVRDHANSAAPSGRTRERGGS